MELHFSLSFYQDYRLFRLIKQSVHIKRFPHRFLVLEIFLRHSVNGFSYLFPRGKQSCVMPSGELISMFLQMLPAHSMRDSDTASLEHIPEETVPPHIREEAVCMSLSPLPDRQTTIICSGDMDGAILRTWATACAVSSAGIIPSTSER